MLPADRAVIVPSSPVAAPSSPATPRRWPRPIACGLSLWTLNATWDDLLSISVTAEALGYAHVWVSDHLCAPFGDPFQPVAEAWTTLAALAATTSRLRLGVLVSANTFRHPALVAKMAVTVDGISHGRAILGLGAGWFELEHSVFGLRFGSSAGERSQWLSESVSVLHDLLDGREVTRHGSYELTGARCVPGPLHGRMPIMIGGRGMRQTLRIAATHADMWNAFGSPADFEVRMPMLQRYCEAAGRDVKDIDISVGAQVILRDTREAALAAYAERARLNGMANHPRLTSERVWLGTPREVAERLQRYTDVGVRTFIVEMAVPHDPETLERFVTEAVPLASTARAPPRWPCRGRIVRLPLTPGSLASKNQ